MPKTVLSEEAPKVYPKRIEAIDFRQMSPGEVSMSWHKLHRGLRYLFGSEAELTGAMRSIVAGELQVWAIFERGAETQQFLGFGLTMLCTKPVTREKLCVLYGLWTAGLSIDTKAWIEALHKLEGWARKQGCTYLEILTDNSRIRQLMNKTGWQMKTYGRKDL